MLAEMCVKTQHIAFKEEVVPIRLLAPVIVASLLPDFTSLTANREKPVIAAVTKTNVLDGIPKIPPKLGVGQKAPILVFPEQSIASIRHARAVRRHGLGREGACAANSATAASRRKNRITVFVRLQFALPATEWISAMYPPGNCTIAEARSSAVCGVTKMSTPAALALVRVSVRLATSYPVISRPYGYGR
jgi:hypothetical protein